MNLALPRIQAAEVAKFGLIVALLFFNAVILESNEVIATSGFVSDIGVQHVVWMWGADMAVVMLTAAIYSIVVDRTNRLKLATAMFAGFGCIYLAMYGLFQFTQFAWLVYPLLTIMNDQQWSLFTLMIWALANDAFSTAQAKRLFPLLAMAVMIGSVVGNAIVTLLPELMEKPGYILLIFNAIVMLTLFVMLLGVLLSTTASNHLMPVARSARSGEQLSAIFTEGLGFVRDIPSFRYLAFAMIPLGFALNTLEFHFLSTIANRELASVQTVYGGFKIAISLSILFVQGFLATWLINQITLRKIFGILPVAQLAGLLLVFAWPIYGIFLGNYLTRVTLVAIDEPARQLMFGLAPDERRGRVSAFMNGYLYPLGAILSCTVVGIVLYLTQIGFLGRALGEHIYLTLGLLAVLFALVMVSRIAKHYDSSLLSWRLDRRKRRSNIPNLEF